MSIDATLAKQQRKTRSTALIVSVVLGVFIVLYVLWLGFAKGHEIKVLPQAITTQASINIQEGVGLTLGSKVYTLGGNVQIAVAAPKYQTQQVLIASDAAQNLTVTLTPMPGVLEAQTEPLSEETTWLLDDKVVAVGAKYEAELAPGEYTLGIEHPFYEDQTQAVTLASTETTDTVLNLTPINATLALQASRADALFTLTNNNTEQVLTYNEAGQYTLRAGSYSVVVSAEGYQTINDALLLTQTQPSASRNYQMQPQRYSLPVAVSPAGGTLVVNGQEQILAEQQTHITVSVARNQSTTLRYSKPGFLAQTQTVQVGKSDRPQANLTLERGLGEVIFSADVPAEVWLDGKRIGNTPQQMRLSTITRTVEFRRPFYRTQTHTFTPRHNDTTRIAVTMQTEYAARRAAGIPTAAQQLGIALKAFQPDEVTLGSPVNEAGRRSDEHPVKVTFTRPILVAKHEITEGQFEAMQRLPDPMSLQGNITVTANHPLPQTNVTWMQAIAFCNWLSALEALPPFYNIQNGQLVGVNPEATGYRLLTEAEWEWLGKAANRATPTKYVWGNRDKVARNHGNVADQSLQGKQSFFFGGVNDGYAEKAPVGSFKADRTGLYDLAGNVAEWVHDRYTLTPPSAGAKVDYLGMTRGNKRVIKGGSYATGRLKSLRVAHRQSGWGADPAVGFRIARYIK